MRVSLDDPRYVSGELIHNTKGSLTVRDKHGNTMRVSLDDPRYISGELISVNKGLVKWNNGDVAIKSYECPGEGWVRGGLSKKNNNRDKNLT
jgi:hypothetical protein